MQLSILNGDITKIEADVIVNAANQSLLGGGGVDGAIHRAGGPDILAQCKAIVARQGGCKTGEAVETTAGTLKARYVIHTVGPIWRGGEKGEEELLKNCYRHSLRLAEKLGCSTIAFPNISTGIYGYPLEEAVAAVKDVISEWEKVDSPLTSVIFVCYDSANFSLYRKAFPGASV